MRTHLANAAHDVLGYGSYPIGLVLMAPIIPRRLQASELMSGMFTTAVMGAGVTVFSPYLPLVSSRRAETTGRHCVSCIAIPYEVQEGSQS
jgi:hypothetical protein